MSVLANHLVKGNREAFDILPTAGAGRDNIRRYFQYWGFVANSLTTFNLFDGSLNEIVLKHGGWPRLLDPTQDTPTDFIAELERAGYSEYTFESIKTRIGKPERQYWIALIASIVKSMQSKSEQDWHGEMLDEFLPKMREHGITDDEIKIAIAGP